MSRSCTNDDDPVRVQGKFNLDGKFPEVPGNVHLWKGLFSESLPAFIKAADRNASGSAQDVTYLHIDCDLYAGTLPSELSPWSCSSVYSA